MPQLQRNVPNFKPGKDIEEKTDTLEGGLNTLLRPTEIKETEMPVADNLLLTGKGVPTGRWGSNYYYKSGSSGSVRLLTSFNDVQNNVNQLLAITDDGLMTKKNNASYTVISGASFLPGLSYQSEQLGNNLYIAGATLPLTKYDGTSLTPYTALVTPSLASVGIASATSGLSEWSWRVTAISLTGETLGSPARSLVSLPLDLTQTAINLAWQTVSAASGVLQGYNVYRGTPGNETLLDSVGPLVTEYLDTGGVASSIIYPPFEDTTAGIKGKYMLKFDDRIVVAGVAGDPSKVYISARYPNHDRFTAIEGGNYVYVQPDDGDEIIGLGIAGNQGMSTGGTVFPASSILVFKKNSVHRVGLSYTSIGNYAILDPQAQLLTASNGCSSGDTVVAVENDTFYFGNKGLFTVGQEPTFLNQIRTNELTARIRPYFDSLSATDYSNANAAYINNKYLLSFPSKKETIIYDRERLAFMGPWKTPWGITKWYNYRDSAGDENWLAGTDSSADVYKFQPNLLNDDGTAFTRILRTKRFNMGGWSVMKVVKLFYLLFRNVRGQVQVNILLETRDGNTTTSKSFTLTSDYGTGGLGADLLGDTQYGDTEATISITGDELARWGQLYKQARVMQIEIIADAANSNFEFLGLRFTGQPLGDQSLSSSLRV